MNCRGMALLTGLLLTAAVALLAVTAAGSMTLLQHQAANFTDKHRARNNAGLAESFAIAWLYSRESVERRSGCHSNCLLPPGIYQDKDIPDFPELEGAAWWQNTGTAAGRHPQSGDLAGYAAPSPADAIWIIEEIRFEAPGDDMGGERDGGIAHYRILSRGQGSHPGSMVITESIVARPWNEGVQALEFPPQSSLLNFCRQFDDSTPCGVQSWRQRR
mgnify:FL=1